MKTYSIMNGKTLETICKEDGRELTFTAERAAEDYATELKKVHPDERYLVAFEIK